MFNCTSCCNYNNILLNNFVLYIKNLFFIYTQRVIHWLIKGFWHEHERITRNQYNGLFLFLLPSCPCAIVRGQLWKDWKTPYCTFTASPFSQSTCWETYNTVLPLQHLMILMGNGLMSDDCIINWFIGTTQSIYLLLSNALDIIDCQKLLTV